MSGGMISIDKLLLIIDTRFKGAAQAKQADKAINDIEKSAQKATKSTKGLGMGMMGLGLSMLFGGMAVQRAGDMMMKSIVKAFVTARGEADPFVNQLLGMQASLEFLKFAIFDTFAQSDLFFAITNAIISMVNGISQFISKHPALATFLVTFAGFAIVAGGLISIFGQLSLAAFSLSKVIEISFGAALFLILSIIVLIGVTFATVIAIFSTDMSTASKVVLSFITLLIGGLVASWILTGKSATGAIKAAGASLKWLAAHPVILLITGLILVGTAIYNMQEAMGGFWNFAKTVFAGFIKLVVESGNQIISQLLNPILSVIRGIKKLASLAGKTDLVKKIGIVEAAVNQLGGGSATIAEGIIAGVDKELGIDKIRAANPDVENFGRLVTGSAGAPSFAEPATGEDILATSQAEVDALASIGGGSSLADIEAKQAEANTLLKEYLDNQKNAKETEFNFNVSGVGGMSVDDMGKMFEEFLINNKERFTGSTSGG